MPESMWVDKLRQIRYKRDVGESSPETELEVLAGFGLHMSRELAMHWRHIWELEAAVLLLTNESHHIDRKIPQILNDLVDYLNDKEDTARLETRLLILLRDLRVALGR